MALSQAIETVLSTLEDGEDWYFRTKITDTVTLIEQPYIHPFLNANIWHVRGTHFDVLVDAGLGVVPLRNLVLEWFDREPVVCLTHGHLDHMGAAYEFSECWANPLDPISDPPKGSLITKNCFQSLGIPGDMFTNSIPKFMITALPYQSFALEAYTLRGTNITRRLEHGNIIDLGNRRLQILHLPGHSPGSICLYDSESLELFSGDVIYDDELVDYVLGSNKNEYADTMLKLVTLPVTRVYPGHGDIFGREKMVEIANEYVRLQEAQRHV